MASILVNPPAAQLIEQPDCYMLAPVPLHGGLYAIEWSKEHLDKGRFWSQQTWAHDLAGGDWRLPSLPVFFATVQSLYEHRGPPNRLEALLRRDLREEMLTTGTRLWYNPGEPSAVIHGYGSRERYSAKAVLREDAIKAQPPETVRALLGVADAQYAHDVLLWISEREPYLTLPPKAPAGERAVALGALCSAHSRINANNVIDDWPARGVRLERL